MTRTAHRSATSADESYVRVAIGLDAAGAAPVAGFRLGEGEEELRAEVSVETVEVVNALPPLRIVPPEADQ